MAKLKFNSIEDAREYVNSLSIQSIVDGYANLLWETQNLKNEPIRITEAQFMSMFKIVGLTKDGEVERRGRKPKDSFPSSDME